MVSDMVLCLKLRSTHLFVSNVFIILHQPIYPHYFSTIRKNVIIKRNLKEETRSPTDYKRLLYENQSLRGFM